MIWQSRAACRGVERRVLYPEDNGFEVGTLAWAEECEAVTRRYCLPCPVRLDCFAEAQEVEKEASRGIWGGVHFVDRRRMRGQPTRCTATVESVPCGAVLDPLIFLRTGETPATCEEHTDV